MSKHRGEPKRIKEEEANCPACHKWIEATTGKRRVFRRHLDWLGNLCRIGRESRRVSVIQ